MKRVVQSTENILLFTQVELDDTLKAQMSSFLLSSSSQQEIGELERYIHDYVANVKQHRIQRDFYLGFAESPQVAFFSLVVFVYLHRERIGNFVFLWLKILSAVLLETI